MVASGVHSTLLGLQIKSPSFWGSVLGYFWIQSSSQFVFLPLLSHVSLWQAGPTGGCNWTSKDVTLDSARCLCTSSCVTFSTLFNCVSTCFSKVAVTYRAAVWQALLKSWDQWRQKSVGDWHRLSAFGRLTAPWLPVVGSSCLVTKLAIWNVTSWLLKAVDILLRQAHQSVPAIQDNKQYSIYCIQCTRVRYLYLTLHRYLYYIHHDTLHTLHYITLHYITLHYIHSHIHTDTCIIDIIESSDTYYYIYIYEIVDRVAIKLKADISAPQKTNRPNRPVMAGDGTEHFCGGGSNRRIIHYWSMIWSLRS